VKVTVLSLFPDVLERYFQSSITSKAVANGVIDYQLVDFREFAADKHRTCDDSPYGGGPGMVIKPEPLATALDSVQAQEKRTIYVTPSGRVFNQEYAEELAQERELVFICGKYEGIDQRIVDLYVDDEISIGDYVLSSGEVAALVVMDTVFRLLEGVISKDSLEEESFTDGLLEYPHYTRPEIFRGLRVPTVLLSGHHEEIRKWRLKKRLEKTLCYRPELLEKIDLDTDMRQSLQELREEEGEENGSDKSN
jgi:tRNA (guanine37-N1)-methyltransferase